MAGAILQENGFKMLQETGSEILLESAGVEESFFGVFILNLADNNLFELPYSSIHYIEELDNGIQATFNFDYTTIKNDIADIYGTTVKELFTSSLTEIWVENGFGKKLFYGVISEYNRSKDASGNYTLQIAAVDYFSLLQKRRTLNNVIYTATDPASIPWDLINISQQSNLPYSDYGITQGATAATGITVNQAYSRNDIRQAVTDLSNFRLANSFDFDIDTSKQLNIYYPTKGSTRLDIVFDESNILADSVKIPIVTSLTNSVIVTGQGINNDVVESVRTASNPVLAAFSLLEDVVSDTQVSDTTVLDNEGDRTLALDSLPLNQISIKHDMDDVDITTYGLGDRVVVDIPEEDISYAQYRVKKRTVEIDNTGTGIVQLDLLTI